MHNFGLIHLLRTGQWRYVHFSFQHWMLDVASWIQVLQDYGLLCVWQKSVVGCALKPACSALCQIKSDQLAAMKLTTVIRCTDSGCCAHPAVSNTSWPSNRGLLKTVVWSCNGLTIDGREVLPADVVKCVVRWTLDVYQSAIYCTSDTRDSRPVSCATSLLKLIHQLVNFCCPSWESDEVGGQLTDCLCHSMNRPVDTAS